MSGKRLQLKRGTTAQTSTFTGLNGEVTVDTTKKTLVVHDGSTVGGTVLAKDSDVVLKVDKVTGKQLSTEDYSTAEKSKLSGIAAGAQVNAPTNLSLGTATNTTIPLNSSTGDDVVLPSATTTLAGLLSGTDKTKLDSISANANNYAHPTSGVSAGTYKSVTVDTNGHVTGGTNPNTASGYGLTDVYTKTQNDTSLALKVNNSEKGVANGVSTLDANGKVVLTQIPDSVLGQLEYMGTKDFTTLPTATQKGQYWIASVSGNGYIVGDWAVWNGSAFDKVDNTDAVATVAGRTGNVVLTKADVGLANVDNTADSAKPVSTAQQTALNAKVTKVTSTDNAIVRFNGTTGEVQNSSGAVIDDSGNVGIGTTPVDAKLDILNNSSSIDTRTCIKVRDNAQSASNVLATTKALTMHGAANTEVGYLAFEHNQGYGGLGTVQLSANGTRTLLFKTNDTERMRIDSAGNVTLPTTTSIGNVSSTELGYLDGVTSSIQTQLAGKAPSSHTHTVSQVTDLGTAATKNVGTAAGNVIEVGAFGLGADARIVSTPDLNASFPQRTEFFKWTTNTLNSPSVAGSGVYFARTTGLYDGHRLLFEFEQNRVWLQARKQSTNEFLPFVEMHHTGNLLQTTGTSTTFPMSQKAATDAITAGDSTAVKLTGNQTIDGIKTFSSAIIGNITGNSGTATKLATTRNIALTGDITGNVNFDGTGNVSIATTIAANSVALGTDTTGNYVAGNTAGTGISIAGTAGEGWSPTIALTNVGAAGTYRSVTTDAQGRVTAGTNPTTLSGYAITDAQTASRTTATFTTVANTWYRIATSAVGMGRNSAEFVVDWTVSGNHGSTRFAAACHYGEAAGVSLMQTNYSKYGTSGITEARIVYHTVEAGNYAYVEVKFAGALTNVIVNVEMQDPLGWTIVVPSTAGSIPTGYSSYLHTFIPSAVITAGTYPKVTINQEGRVTSGTTLVAADIPVLDTSKITTGTLPVSRGGTGVTTSTGTGNVVLSTSPTLTTPNIGVATGTSFNSITGLATVAPLIAGTATVGTSTLAARQDHIHSVQTTITGNAGTATKLATIPTTFSGEYPVAFDVNGLIYSHSGITYNGTTNTLKLANVSATESIKLGNAQQASIQYNSTDNSIDFIIN